MRTQSNFHLVLSLVSMLAPVVVRSADPVVQKQISVCTCETNKGKIDLTPLDQTNRPKFSVIAKDGSGEYYYNPCSPFTIGTSGCSGVLGCQLSGSTYYPLATPTSAHFTNDPANGQLMVTYNATFESNVRKMQVQLVCDPTVEAEFDPSGDKEQSLVYVMKLNSKHACPKAAGGLSTGSVLCIIFAVVVGVYLIGGSLYMYFVKGSRGQEVIPNVDFWKEYPSYVKDGVVFVVHKFKGSERPREYQSI